MPVKESSLITVRYGNGLILQVSRYEANVCEICRSSTDTHHTRFFTGISDPRSTYEGNWVCLPCRWKREEVNLNDNIAVMAKYIKPTEVTEKTDLGFQPRKYLIPIDSTRIINSLIRFVDNLAEAASGRSQIIS